MTVQYDCGQGVVVDALPGPNGPIYVVTHYRPDDARIVCETKIKVRALARAIQLCDTVCDHRREHGDSEEPGLVADG